MPCDDCQSICRTSTNSCGGYSACCASRPGNGVGVNTFRCTTLVCCGATSSACITLGYRSGPDNRVCARLPSIYLIGCYLKICEVGVLVVAIDKVHDSTARASVPNFIIKWSISIAVCSCRTICAIRTLRTLRTSCTSCTSCTSRPGRTCNTIPIPDKLNFGCGITRRGHCCRLFCLLIFFYNRRGIQIAHDARGFFDTYNRGGTRLTSREHTRCQCPQYCRSQK